MYLADLSPRFGTEAGKLRPVLVIQSDLLNDTDHPSTWVLPCTTRVAGGSVLRVELPRAMAGNAQDCEIMIDQSRAIDNHRVKRALGHLPPALLAEVKAKLRQLAEL
jgi:mRNA interferase MazF